MLTKPEETQLAEIPASPPSPLPAYENPADVVRRSGQWATALMEAVEDRRMYADMSGKKYLEVEAWQLVGMFANAHTVPQNPVALEKDGEIIGYECTAIVFQHGTIVSQGTMSCGLDAFPCRGKAGSEKNKAAMSAAQTWAISKALRNKFSFVAKLAGFEGTTADEMRGNDGAAFGGNSQDFCPLHEQTWREAGQKKEWMHIVEGQKGPKGGNVWCKKDDFLAGLMDQMAVVAKTLDAAKLADIKKRWKSMSPAEQYQTVQGLQQPSGEAATEDEIETDMDDIYEEGPDVEVLV
jgi:hypothetical protein